MGDRLGRVAGPGAPGVASEAEGRELAVSVGVNGPSVGRNREAEVPLAG